jgi:transposase
MAAVLGIDVGKADVHCCLIVDERSRTNSFPNTATGYDRLLSWLKNRGVDHVHVCLEATGGWSEELGTFLHDRGHDVSIVNPTMIKAFGQSVLSRTKTDKADAALIARYCATAKPRLWTPPSPSQRRLLQLGRRRASLDEMRVQEQNRLNGPGSTDVRQSLEGHIAFLGEQIVAIDTEIASVIDDDPTLRGRRDLLESIPGIGPRVAATILGELPRITEFRSGKALAAFAGLCPREFRSGTSVSVSWLSKVGNTSLRRVLFLPAMTAIRHNPLLSAWAEGLRVRGKRPKQIVVAAMRRLLILAYGVLKSGRPFEGAISH